MKFIAHNIQLKQSRTMPGDSLLLADKSWWQAAKKTIELFMPNRTGLRAVDLGCLEGGYTVELARMGFAALGIEARKENYEKCEAVRQGLNFSNLSFAQDDVRNIESYDAFDLTFCYGLLYHLDTPAVFLHTVARCTTKMLLLHTHYALENDILSDIGANKFFSPIQKRVPFLNKKRNYKLSKMTTNEGYRGRWYTEWNPDDRAEAIEANLEASYNNPRSFWPTKKELTRMLHEAGFTHVFEQFDFTGDTTPENYTEYNQRSMFIAIK